MKLNWIVIIFIVAGTAYFGWYYSKQGVNSWYKHLHKPKDTPSGELIGSIWTFLYILIAVAVLWFWNIPAFTWYHYVVGAFLLYNAYLNATWNKVFFVDHDLKKAYMHIRRLDVVTVVVVVMMAPVSPIAAFLLLPYLLWLLYATKLARGIWQLNK